MGYIGAMRTEPIPNEYLARIGSIITTFNNLDHLLTVALVEITGNDFTDINSHIPFANMNYGVKKVMLDLIVKTKAESAPGLSHDLDAIEGYMRSMRIELEEAAAERNAVAHSIWTSDGGHVTRRRMRAKRKVEIETIPVSLAELEVTLNKIERCRERLAAFAFTLKFSKVDPHWGQTRNSSSALLQAASEE